MGNCAGIDWASEKHEVLIEDPAGEELLAGTFGHDEDGVSALCAALACFDVELVAIERPDGLLVDRLLDAGVRVLALHHNQVKAARDRFRGRVHVNAGGDVGDRHRGPAGGVQRRRARPVHPRGPGRGRR